MAIAWPEFKRSIAPRNKHFPKPFGLGYRARRAHALADLADRPCTGGFQPRTLSLGWSSRKCDLEPARSEGTIDCRSRLRGYRQRQGHNCQFHLHVRILQDNDGLD